MSSYANNFFSSFTLIYENNKNLIIKSSEFNDDIGAIGAAALVLQEEFAFINKTV